MLNSLKRISVLFSCLFIILAVPASATLSLTVQGGNVKPIPIAITDFKYLSNAAVNVGADIQSVIRDDFKNSGYFKFINKRSYPQTSAEIKNKPNFGAWKKTGAQALVSGSVQLMSGGQVRVKFSVWDVIAQKEIYTRSLLTVKNNWRRFAHMISDQVYEQLMGEKGYFDSKIIYVSEPFHQRNTKKRIAVMDYDGANHRFLTAGNEMVSTPRFSPDFSKFVYVQFVKKRYPYVYIYNMRTGQRSLLGTYKGISFAPRFSPDGKKVIFSMAVNGNTDIYIVDIATKQMKRVTDNPGIDTAPSFSPDGKKIVFESDRGNRQQIYVKNLVTGQVKRISFKNGRYATPVWSPKGDLVAFTKMHLGQFYIGVMKPDGSGERFLTKAYHVEGPSWAPNGRVLTFFQKSRNDSRGNFQSGLFRIDVSGLNKEEIRTPMNASDPAWSSLLPN